VRDIHQTARTSRGQYGSDRSGGATIVYPATADPAADTRAARVWPNALHPFRSPCRIDPDKGFRQHRCSGSHASAVQSYRAWRDGEYAAAETHDTGTANSPGHDAGDGDAYFDTRARPTFGAFLTMMRDTSRHD
jgi:hypothetical protein